MRTLTAVHFVPLKPDPHHCFSILLFPVWKPTGTYAILLPAKFFTWQHIIRQFDNRFSKRRGRNTSLRAPLDGKRWSTVTYAASLWRCSTGPPNSSRTDQVEQRFWQCWHTTIDNLIQPHPTACSVQAWQLLGDILTQHLNVGRNGQRLPVLLGREEDAQEVRDAGLCWYWVLYSDSRVPGPRCHPRQTLNTYRRNVL